MSAFLGELLEPLLEMIGAIVRAARERSRPAMFREAKKGTVDARDKPAPEALGSSDPKAD
jgi:hypothetical protein